MHKPSTPTSISLFSSGGIGDFGLKQAGFRTLATAELLPKRLEIQRLNNIADDDSGYICGDLNNPQVLNKVLSQAEKHTSTTGQPVTLVTATPPCQGMSVANHKKSDELARNSLVVRSIEIVSSVQPLVFVFENVPAFLKTECTGSDGVNRPIEAEIERTLGKDYEYYSRTLQLHQFGSPSSRKRSITIGVRNDVLWATPLDLFPSESPASSLEELIGHLKPLGNPQEFDREDIWHAFRPYKEHMRSWISATPEGESAFDNEDSANRPHRIINGVRVDNVRKNGDKYRRVPWDSIPPCVHTRNDILASQNTVHPRDDRVFSIRELMLMMGLTEDFQWVSDLEVQAAVTDEDIQKLLKRHAPNIRQCLGEGVPAPIFRKIGENIVNHLLSQSTIKSGRVKRNPLSAPITTAQKAAYTEIDANRKKANAAYYTQPLPAFAVLKRVWQGVRETNKNIKVLEPSVGSGVFVTVLSQLIDKESVDLTVVDIDSIAIRNIKSLSAEVRNKFSNIQSINENYLNIDFESPFDFAIGNPPFGRGPKSENAKWGDSFEIADQFFRKTITEAEKVALVFPKAILHSQGYQNLRDALLDKGDLHSILDFGELAFPDAKVETIGIHLQKISTNDSVFIKSWPLNRARQVQQSYIADPSFPSWVIYRDSKFDHVIENSKTGRLSAWRDRSLSRKKGTKTGPYVVFRGKNVGTDGFIVRSSEDYRVDQQLGEAVRTKVDSLSGNVRLLVPNLSYYPRAVEFPNDPMAIPEGSCAVLYGDLRPDEAKRVVKFASTSAYSDFYRIACNFATRSINVDQCLAFWWVVPNDELVTNAI